MANALNVKDFGTEIKRQMEVLSANVMSTSMSGQASPVRPAEN